MILSLILMQLFEALEIINIFFFCLKEYPRMHFHHHTSIYCFSFASFDISGNSCGEHRVVVSTAALHARVRGSVCGLGGLKETKFFLPHPLVKLSIVGSLSDREVECKVSHIQGSNFEACVWRAVSYYSSHNPQKVLLAQFGLYVHKGDPIQFISKSHVWLVNVF